MLNVKGESILNLNFNIITIKNYHKSCVVCFNQRMGALCVVRWSKQLWHPNQKIDLRSTIFNFPTHQKTPWQCSEWKQIASGHLFWRGFRQHRPGGHWPLLAAPGAGQLREPNCWPRTGYRTSNWTSVRPSSKELHEEIEKQYPVHLEKMTNTTLNKRQSSCMYKISLAVSEKLLLTFSNWF